MKKKYKTDINISTIQIKFQNILEESNLQRW